MIVKKKYKALGFVEVLIAIVVVGIASAVFLTMSGRAMKELVQTERIEYMGRISRDGVTIAQTLADREKNDPEADDWFPDFINTGPIDPPRCFLFEKEDPSSDDYIFAKDGGGDYIKCDQINDDSRRKCIVSETDTIIGNNLHIYESEPYFLSMCVTNIDPNNQWVNVYFLVGDINLKGEITSDSDVKDLKYYSIIDI